MDSLGRDRTVLRRPERATGKSAMARPVPTNLPRVAPGVPVFDSRSVLDARLILYLQRSAGNHAVTALLTASDSAGRRQPGSPPTQPCDAPRDQKCEGAAPCPRTGAKDEEALDQSQSVNRTQVDLVVQRVCPCVSGMPSEVSLQNQVQREGAQELNTPRAAGLGGQVMSAESPDFPIPDFPIPKLPKWFPRLPKIPSPGIPGIPDKWWGPKIPTLPKVPKLPKLPPLGPESALGTGCDPYATLEAAERAHDFVRASYLPWVSKFGFETLFLWFLYLSRAPIPRAKMTYAGSGGIVDGFQAHPKTQRAEEGLVAEVVKEAAAGKIALMPEVPRKMPLQTALGAGRVWSLLNENGELEMSFDDPENTIPGNIAGGVGSGDVDLDTRNAWGNVTIVAHLGPPRTVEATSSTADQKSDLVFHVHDTVDFCPGFLGGDKAKIETIPMSRLEKTGTKFGQPFAGDIPFDVTYSGKGVTRSGPWPGSQPPSSSSAPPPPVKLSNSLLFDFDSDKVKPEATPSLEKLLPALRKSPKTTVTGHTDSKGTEVYNQDLSVRRARAVVNKLEELEPLLKSRLKAEGRGKNEPIESNDTAPGRAKNRRVEIVYEGS